MSASRAAWMVGAVAMMGCAAQASPPAVASGPSPAVAPEVREAPRAAAVEAAHADGVGETRCSELLKAKGSFQAFIAKADGRGEYAAAVERAQERVEDIDRMLAFMGEGGGAAPCK